MLLLLQIIFSEIPVQMLLYLNSDHFYGCFSYFRGPFRKVQDASYNLRFKLSFLRSSFGCFTKRNFLESPALSIKPFQKVQRELQHPWFLKLLCLVQKLKCERGEPPRTPQQLRPCLLIFNLFSFKKLFSFSFQSVQCTSCRFFQTQSNLVSILLQERF